MQGAEGPRGGEGAGGRSPRPRTGYFQFICRPTTQFLVSILSCLPFLQIEDLDLEELGRAGVDFYTGNLHKWGLAPRGCAVLWYFLNKTAFGKGWAKTDFEQKG